MNTTLIGIVECIVAVAPEWRKERFRGVNTGRARTRQAGEHAAERVGGGDLALHRDPLNRRRGQVGQEDRERRDEGLAERA